MWQCVAQLQHRLRWRKVTRDAAALVQQGQGFIARTWPLTAYDDGARHDADYSGSNGMAGQSDWLHCYPARLEQRDGHHWPRPDARCAAHAVMESIVAKLRENRLRISTFPGCRAVGDASTSRLSLSHPPRNLPARHGPIFRTIIPD